MEYLTFNGKTMKLTDWARSNGMHEATLRNRLANGWDVGRALTEPVNSIYNGSKTGASKNDAELALNDLPRDKFPQCLAHLVKNKNAKKLGKFVRNHHRKEFDQWFEDDFARPGGPEKYAALSAVPQVA